MFLVNTETHAQFVMSELLVKLCNARWRGEQHSHRGVSGNQLPLSRGSGLATREWQHATHAHVPGLWPFDSHIINSSSRHAGLPVAVALMRGRPSQRLVNRASVIRQLDGQLTWPALELPLNPQLKVAPVQVSRKTWKLDTRIINAASGAKQLDLFLTWRCVH